MRLAVEKGEQLQKGGTDTVEPRALRRTGGEHRGAQPVDDLIEKGKQAVLAVGERRAEGRARDARGGRHRRDRQQLGAAIADELLGGCQHARARRLGRGEPARTQRGSGSTCRVTNDAFALRKRPGPPAAGVHATVRRHEADERGFSPHAVFDFGAGARGWAR